MKRRTPSEITGLMRDLGVGAGDRISVAAFIPAIGLVEDGLPGLYAGLRDAVGREGTIIVPTFTASYRRGEIFDVRNSRCINGALSEYVRTLPEAVRSLDPLFSMAAAGPDAGLLMARTGPNCFGEESVYETLFEQGVKFLGLGVDWDQGYSFFMHLERLARVPFRLDLHLSGVTRDADGREFEDEAIHYARNEDMDWRRDRGPFCRELLRTGAVREIERDGCPFRLFEPAETRALTLAALDDDPWCMTNRRAA